FGLGRELRWRPFVAVADEPQGACDLPSQLRRRDGRGTPVLADDPGGELPRTRVPGHKDAVVYVAVLAVRPFDPPGGVPAHLDLVLAGHTGDLQGRAVAGQLHAVLPLQAEIPLRSST